MKIKKAGGHSTLLSLCAVGCSLYPTTGHSATVALEAVNSGYYSVNGVANGNQGNAAIWGDNYRDWLGFNVSGFNGTINSATLQVWSDSRNASGQTINWRDVTTPYPNLGANGVSVFNDLGSGTLYAQGTQTRGGLNSFVLNPAGVASLNAAQGSKWAVGGQEAAGGGYAFGYLGGVSAPNNPIRLVMDVQTPATHNVAQPGSPIKYVTIDAVNSGYYNFYGTPDGNKANPAVWGDTVRGWLGFDLAGIDGVITSANLQVWSDPRNATGQTVNWWSVTTPYNDLGKAAGWGIFSDLGSGVLLGEGAQVAGSLNSYKLNADALDALNSAEGSKWAIGGQEFAGGGFAHGYLSGVSTPNNPIRLVLGIQSRAIPETGSSMALLAFGFCSVVGVRTLRTRRKDPLARI